jgi:8-oxo-dGTP pyrophosphatase MutT (NUDIX family)
VAVNSPARSQVLLPHQRKDDRWFQPGGHSNGDPDTLRIALRETSGESGVAPEHTRPLSEDIVDVDIPTIPASRKVSAHVHFDIRCLLEMDDTVPLLRSEASHEIAWITLAQVARLDNHRSVVRTVEKIRRLRERQYLPPPRRSAALG